MSNNPNYTIRPYQPGDENEIVKLFERVTTAVWADGFGLAGRMWRYAVSI